MDNQDVQQIRSTMAIHKGMRWHSDSTASSYNHKSSKKPLWSQGIILFCALGLTASTFHSSTGNNVKVSVQDDRQLPLSGATSSIHSFSTDGVPHCALSFHCSCCIRLQLSLGVSRSVVVRSKDTQALRTVPFWQRSCSCQLKMLPPDYIFVTGGAASNLPARHRRPWAEYKRLSPPAHNPRGSRLDPINRPPCSFDYVLNPP